MAATPTIIIIDKATGAQTAVTKPEFTLPAQSAVELSVPRAQVKTLARHGSDLIITTIDGETIVIHEYFAHDANALVIEEQGGLWASDLSSLSAQPGDASVDAETASNLFTPVDSMASLFNPPVSVADAGAAAADIPAWLPLAAAGASAGVTAVSGSGSNGSSSPQQGASPPASSNSNPGGTAGAAAAGKDDAAASATQPSSPSAGQAGNISDPATAQWNGSITINAVHPDSGASASGFITNDNTLVFSGTLSSPLAGGQTAQISLDGKTWNDVTVNGATWTYDNTANKLPDGAYAVAVHVVTVTPEHAITTSPVTQQIVIDTTAPDQTVSINSGLHPASGAGGVSYALTGTISAALADGGQSGVSAESVQVSLDGGQTWHDAVVNGTAWVYSLTSLPPDDFTSEARVVDLAGNAGAVSTQAQIVHAALSAPTVALADGAESSGPAGFVIQGFDGMGASISSAGDINGDGLGDLIIGAPSYRDDGGIDAGKAYVIFGKGPGGIYGELDATSGQQVLDLAYLTPVDGFIIQGDSMGDLTGISVSSAGDINGDGYDDLIVGAPFANGGGFHAGAAYVVFGKGPSGVYGSLDTTTGRQVLDLDHLAPADGFIFQGDGTYAVPALEQPGDVAGMSVSSAGDINGDGYDDFIVGAPVASGGGLYTGAAYVVFGKGPGGIYGEFDAATGRQMLDLASLKPADGFIIEGDSEIDLAGFWVSSAGDINGDGYDELVVGAANFSNDGTWAGEAYVVFGKGPGGIHGNVDPVTGRQVLDMAHLSPTDGFVIQGDKWIFDTSNYCMSTAVSSAGDINGDGYNDLIIGMNYSLDDGGGGKVYVVYGKGPGGVYGSFDAITGRQVLDLAHLSPTEGFIIQGYSATAGVAVSSGDINGDGYDDLIVGMSSGESYVVYGKGPGGVYGNFDAATGRQVLDLDHLAPADGFIIQDGFAAFAGDINGDGLGDLIVGVPLGDGGGASANATANVNVSISEAYVVYGHAGPFGSVDATGRAVLDLAHLLQPAGQDNGPAFKGTAEPGATVAITLDGQAPVTVTADAATGAWHYTPAGLADGTHSVSVTQTDAAGNTSPASEVLTFHVGASAPAVASPMSSIDQAIADAGAPSPAADLLLLMQQNLAVI